MADLQPGDVIWRLDLVVASVESAGVDSTGAQLLAVYFDANPGREIWRADRALTVIRGGRRTIPVTPRQVSAAKIVRALDQAEGRASDEWIERLTRAVDSGL